MRARLFLGFLPLLAPLLAAGAALAQPTQPLDRLLPQIRRDHPGQFLDAEGITRNGAPGYRLKWMNQGRITEMDVDARTGRVMQAPDRPGAFGRRDEMGGFDRARPRDGDAVPDRGDEGREDRRSYQPRDTRGDDARFGNRSRFGEDGGNDGEARRFTRPGFGQRDGDGRPDFGNRFERGGGNARNFGGRENGGGFGRSDRGFGNRNFGGGGRERRGR